MINRNLLVTGQPGAGKTTLARWLARRAPRVLVLDPVCDYVAADLAEPGGALVIDGDLPAAIDSLADTRDEPFALVYRPADDVDPAAEYDLLLRAVEAVQREPDSWPLVLVIDEASLSGDVYELAPQLRRLYNVGRRWWVGLVVVIQDATDIHRITRRNAAALVTMRQTGGLAADLQRRFDTDRVALLHELVPGTEPRAGVHYLTFPPGTDLAEWWEPYQRG